MPTDATDRESAWEEPEMITSCRRLLAVADTNPELFNRLVRGDREGIDSDLVRDMDRVQTPSPQEIKRFAEIVQRRL